jgi:cytochrome b
LRLGLDAIRFALELCLLAAVAYWALELDAGTAVRVGLAVLAPITVCFVWGLFVAPKARYPLPRPVWVALQLVLFGLVALALAQAGQAALGIAFFVAALVDLAALIAVAGGGLRGTGAP